MPELVLSIPEVQDTLKIGRNTVYTLIDQGRLTLLKIGRRSVITVKSIEKLIAELEAEAEQRETLADDPSVQAAVAARKAQAARRGSQ